MHRRVGGKQHFLTIILIQITAPLFQQQVQLALIQIGVYPDRALILEPELTLVNWNSQTMQVPQVM